MLVPLLLCASTVSAASLQLLFLRSQPALAPLQQPDSAPPDAQPYRPLPWGEVNILSTTDTHGWLMGHQRNEPSYSGDWGDLYSFVSRMKDEARRRGVDLLLVDSGDRVDGNGLVDAEPSEHPKGYTALDIFSQMPYDVVTTGNHELYKDPVAAYVSEVMAGKYGEKWVVSNVNLTITDEKTGETYEKRMGNRLRKFKTEQGRKVTAFGPLFDFKAHGKTITVQKPSEMAKEQWFLDAILDKPDFFLFVGHMSLRIEPDSEWSTLVRTIREIHPTVPVLVFGGHHHIRDCVQEDPYSMSLAAGRYMETVGWVSMSGLDESKPPQFKRRYLDQNRNTYAYHVGEDFDTPEGKNITTWLSQTAERFNLTEQFGVAPQDYYLHRFPHTTPHSIFHLLTSSVLPTLVNRPDRPHKPFTVLNSGSVRFDVFKGPFTRNDQWIILPFTNNFLYVPSVPLPLARKLLHHLNLVGEHGLASSSVVPTLREQRKTLSALAAARPELFSPDALRAAEDAEIEQRSRRRMVEQNKAAAAADADADGGRWKLPRTRLTEGYVTLDACGGADKEEQLGDDTAHKPYRTARQPVFVGTALPDPDGDDEEEKVDVVFFDFITPDILSALNVLGGKKGRRYGVGDVEQYIPSEELTANTLMEAYAKRAWN
ncbi:hypothetical protein JCM8097_003252 [Rhodosporidiobolus ruineniae]